MSWGGICITRACSFRDVLAIQKRGNRNATLNRISTA